MTTAFVELLLSAWTDDSRQRPPSRPETVAHDTVAPLNAADTELATRIREGDAAAFRTLMQSHFNAVAQVAYQLLQSSDAADDVAQQLFARLWEQHTSFHPTRSIRNYLLTAGRRGALMVLRHHGVQHRHAEGVRAMYDEAVEVDDADDIDAPGQLLTVEAVLAMLSERQRTAVELRYLQQLPYAAIGDVLGVSAGAAEQVVIRALDKIRRAMRAQGDAENRGRP